MQATLMFYIVVGILTVVPLLLFNINRVFVRKKPEPMKINWVRGVVILLLCAFIVFFLWKGKSLFCKKHWSFCLSLCLPVVFHALSN